MNKELEELDTHSRGKTSLKLEETKLNTINHNNWKEEYL